MDKTYYGAEYVINLYDDEMLSVGYLFSGKKFAISEITALYFYECKLLWNTIPINNGAIIIKTEKSGTHLVAFGKSNQGKFRELYDFLREKTGLPEQTVPKELELRARRQILTVCGIIILFCIIVIISVLLITQ